MLGYKVLISDGLEEIGQEILRRQAQVDDRSGINAADLMGILPEYDALIVRGRTKVTAELLQGKSRLKVIGRAGVGVDNIDLSAAADRGITVVNAPVATSIAVAELTIALILSLVREIPRADASLKAGQWLKKELIGSEIAAKQLGIIGMGRIGAEVARRLAAFDLVVLGYDPFLSDLEITRRGAQPRTFENLLKESDFITIHIPYTDQTHHLIDQNAVDLMKTGVFLICTARGGIIDEQVLLSALNSGKIAGAALDVFEQEPPGISALFSHPKLIATPHIGAQTFEAQRRAARDIAEEVLAALGGQPLRWKIV